MHPKAKSMTRSAALTVALALAAAHPRTAAGTTWIVGSTADSGPSTLRNALANAEDGDTIDFEVSGTIALTSGQLMVDKSVTIQANTETVTVDGQQASRVFHIALGKTVAISGLTIANGRTSAQGGGIFNAGALTLRDCTLRDSWAAMGGGGVYAEGTRDASEAVTITGCTLSGNGAGITAPYYGGGAVALVSVDHDYLGADVSRVDTLTVENSLLTSNNAPSGGGIVVDVEGGTGSYYGWENALARVTVLNSTLSDNSAENVDGNGSGGAIAMMNFGGMEGQVTLNNCTLSGNRDTAGASGILNDGCTVDLQNTVLANAPSGANLVNGWLIGSGTVTSHGGNLSTDDGGGLLASPSDIVSTDPLLGSLQDNGGPTRTCALLAGSPAIDAGVDTGGLPATDQRGYPRLVNGTADIGAYESGFQGCFITNNYATGSAVVLHWTAFPDRKSVV
mgnify:CR=1 FL=1